MRSGCVRATVTSPNITSLRVRAGRGRDGRGDLDGDIEPRLDVCARRGDCDELACNTKTLVAEIACELTTRLRERCARLYPQDERFADELELLARGQEHRNAVV